MEIEKRIIASGPANGKHVIRIKGHGSFQSVNTELYGIGARMIYIVNQYLGSTTICDTLQEVANFLKCDYDTFIEKLYEIPDWNEE